MPASKVQYRSPARYSGAVEVSPVECWHNLLLVAGTRVGRKVKACAKQMWLSLSVAAAASVTSSKHSPRPLTTTTTADYPVKHSFLPTTLRLLCFMATSQHKNKKASKSREVRQIAAKTALQKREKSRKGTSKARMTELTDELNRQYAEVGMQPSTTVCSRALGEGVLI